MTRRTRLAPIVLMALLAVLAPAGAPAAGQAPTRYLDRVFAEVSVTYDLAYGAAPDEHGRVQELNVDVYAPAGDGATDRPAIVLAHGGGFVGGNKGHMGGLARAYAHRGFVALSIEYRMDEGAGGISFPPSAAETARILAAKHDMQAAVRWTRAQAGALGVDPRKVAVGGSSAGAVMAVVAATMPDDPGASGTPGLSSAVCTAVSLAGAGDPALVDAGDAGAIFFHGDRDTTVPYSQAVLTHQAMVGADLPTEMVTFPGVGHGLGNGDLIEQRSAEWLVETMVERDTSCAGPVDGTAPAFVQAAYSDLLGRPPTAAELEREVGLLDVGGTRKALLVRLTTSDEWLGSIVTGLYEDTLGRAPDAEGLAFWVGELRSGRRTVARVASSFLAATEFHQRAGGTDQAWVEALYAQVLGRDGTPEDVAHWVAQTALRGRSWVATWIHGSIESRRARVTALYQHLLGRAPEPGGLAHWADRVARDGDLALARSLALSREYAARAVTRFP